MTLRTIPDSEQASRAEMLFAGHGLNIFGILLLLTGLVSYFRTSGASELGSAAVSVSGGASSLISGGGLAVLLSAALGVVLLVAGETFYQREMRTYSPPLITAGYCLLFFTACAAHFLFQLVSESALFFLLLPVVAGSTASIFRYNSKMIGNVMLIVYFFTPLFITFRFQSFGAIFCYLLAVNLGSVLVAFYKKWDFQLLAAALGSYAFYFAHFRSATASRSLLILLSIYGLSLLVNNLLYYLREVQGDYNVMLSFINPTAFGALSAVLIMAFPNWVRVSLYFGLFLLHLVLALLADDRRGQNANFHPLASSNLALSLLFCWAGISFITYFSDSTTYFGPVTLLMFVLTLSLQGLSFRLQRHRTVLSRFGFFGLLLGAAQVWYVLPSMESSGLWHAVSLALFGAYLVVYLYRRFSLSEEEQGLLHGALVVGIPLVLQATITLSAPLGLAVLGLSAVLSLQLPCRPEQFPLMRLLVHGVMAGLAWAHLGPAPLGLWEGVVLLLTLAALSFSVQGALKQGKNVGMTWYWVALLGLRLSVEWEALSFGALLLGLATFHLGLAVLGARVLEGRHLLHFTAVPSTLLAVLSLETQKPEMPALTAALALLLCSQWCVGKRGQELHTWNSVMQVVILAKIGSVFYHPYPWLCLGVLAGLATYLAYRQLLRLSLVLYILTALGALLLPWQTGALSNVFGLLCLPSSFALGYHFLGAGCFPSKEENAVAGMGVLLFTKFSLLVHLGAFSTLLWTGLACALLVYHLKVRAVEKWTELGQGLFDYSLLLYFGAFLKSICIDANLMNRPTPTHYLCAFLVSGLFLLSAHLWVNKREARNVFVVLGLLMACFQLTFLAHGWWGDRLLFQPILSGFWSLVGFFIVSAGVASSVRIYRLFGLTTLVGNTVKILLVDIHVLDSYSKTNTYLILGCLLMMTSFLYQKQRDRLCGRVLPNPQVEPAPL